MKIIRGLTLTLSFVMSGNRHAGLFVVFQRAYDTLQIVRMDGLIRDRVNILKLLMKG